MPPKKYQQTGGASHSQIGRAAAKRTHTSGATRQDLNKIVHSADKDPHKHGHNPYADPTATYDPQAEKALKRANA
eukprot:CAMPEP_0198357518 /NCGR_PEP_ID=MMETSP1450-20131203/127144_1 /TAXON_ID=753684 ORGANISM="Madagascaria erythrocladiodes, Strain CCMP3234" /NCGR_SAMPLE_ID=MMETSP1450 /ASSEMBLY_ACC=CAM_ASM_001115 /LENGTH=74 /DNA_ID=CAMNT_0044064157 /DNA_START=191 /DNA_END=415 /DNA_ORIENTATION=+